MEAQGAYPEIWPAWLRAQGLHKMDSHTDTLLAGSAIHRRNVRLFFTSSCAFLVACRSSMVVMPEVSSASGSTVTEPPATHETATSVPTKTPTPTSTVTLAPTLTPSPTPTVTPSATVGPPVTYRDRTEVCFDPSYAGIRHCTLGEIQILTIDPKHPLVRFEVVLSVGYDRHGNFGECRDVNVPDSLIAGMSRGPGCYYGEGFPGERVSHMIARYPGAVAGFNADFFSFPDYARGPFGLTVKNGVRLDGGLNDRDGREVRRSSLSISTSGEIRIGVVDKDILPDPEAPWHWQPDQETFFTTVGGLPLLVQGGQPTNLKRQCQLEEGWCPDPKRERARTAVGKTEDGRLLVVVVPEEPGITLRDLAELMLRLNAVDAINLDGGGSSTLWYGGGYLVPVDGEVRPVVEAILVFSTPLDRLPSCEHGEGKGQCDQGSP